MYKRDNTDIKRVTEDMLLKAAMLAERGNDNPSDHMNGIFTDLQKQDIDTYGWILLNKHRERENMEKDVSKAMGSWQNVLNGDSLCRMLV